MNKKFRWLRYDLHMHSQYSKQKDKSRVIAMDAAKFVDIISTKVDVFSVTDHNYYSNKFYTELREVIKDKNMAVIDGAELDVFVDKSKNIKFQMLVYFEKNEKGDEIENTIKNLYANKQKPVLSEIISELLKLNIKFILIPEGNKSNGISKITNKLDKLEYDEIAKYAMYKIFSGFDVTKNFSEENQDIWAENFYKDSKSFNSKTKNLKDKELKEIIEEIRLKIKDKELKITALAQEIYEYILKYSKYFAYFKFSDWHNNEPYDPHINNFVFSSLETAFDSFEIAVLDPSSRTILSKEPEIVISPNIISNIEFNLNNVKHNIHFTPGLNAIIGSRGSGKSLLIAVIKRLLSTTDETINAYSKNYKISNIKGEDYGGINIVEGSLKSMAILEQSQIEKIYEDPDTAWNSILSKFPTIAKLNMENIYDIQNELQKISPIDNNFKTVTTNIKQIKKIKTIIYKKINEIETNEIESNIQNASLYLKKILSYLETVGFMTDDFSKEISKVTTQARKYVYIILKLNEISNSHNNRIKELQESRTTEERIKQESLEEISNALNILKTNFEKLLTYKKIEILIQNFKFEVVPAKTKKYGKYLFVTSYKIPEDLKETIIEEMIAPIKKVRGKTGIEKLKAYVLGEATLAKNKNIDDDFNKFVREPIFESEKEFYQITDNTYNFSKLTSNKAIEEAEKNKAIINLTNSSLGMKSVAYLDMLFDTNEKILLFDQPEDNIDNKYISEFLVPLIKSKKQDKQLIFVTHNPSVAVYGDAFNYIYTTNEEGEINYKNYFIESKEEKDNIIRILEGGRPSFSNRNKKYGDILGEEEYGTNHWKTKREGNFN